MQISLECGLTRNFPNGGGNHVNSWHGMFSQRNKCYLELNSGTQPECVFLGF